MEGRVGIIRYIFLPFVFLSFGIAEVKAELAIRFGPEAPPKVVEITFADIPTVTIPRANKPVKLGQPFTECAWKQALKINAFFRTKEYAMQIARGLSGGGDAEGFLKQAFKPRQKTNVFLLFDEQNLYIGFQCLDDDMEHLSVELTQKRDGAVWGADSVEVFLAPWKSSAEYFHFIADSRGTLYDARNRFFQDEGGRRRVIDNTWNPDIQVFTKTFDTYWIAQFAIPFKVLHLPSGERMRMNLCRTERIGMKSEHSSWVQVEEIFHETERFGEISFGQKPLAPPVKMVKIAFPDPLWGENNMKVWVRNNGKTDTQATIKAELLDTKANPEDTVSRTVLLKEGYDTREIFLPYRITEFGKHTIYLQITNPSGKDVYDQRIIPLATTDVLFVACPDSYFSTQPSGTAVTTLNVSPVSLDEIQLRYTVLAEGKAVDKKDVHRVDSRVIYTEIGLEHLKQDVPYQLQVDVIHKTTGKMICRKTLSFRRIPLSW